MILISSAWLNAAIFLAIIVPVGIWFILRSQIALRHIACFCIARAHMRDLEQEATRHIWNEFVEERNQQLRAHNLLREDAAEAKEHVV